MDRHGSANIHGLWFGFWHLRRFVESGEVYQLGNDCDEDGAPLFGVLQEALLIIIDDISDG